VRRCWAARPCAGADATVYQAGKFTFKNGGEIHGMKGGGYVTWGTLNAGPGPNGEIPAVPGHHGPQFLLRHIVG